MEKITKMATYYNQIKKMIIDKGYGNELMWINNIPNPDKDLFFKEYSWVVINSGMKNSIAEKIFKNFWNNGSPDFSAINHPHKNKSMKKVYERLDFYFLHFIKSKNKLMFLKSLPHIGDVTKFHLARNLGLNYAKPDRHLVRISSLFKDINVQELCKKLSILTDDSIGLVDLVLWRFATLYPNYLELIKEEIIEVEKKKECEFKESCEKHSWMCFNEYVDVCSTRFVLLLSKALKDRKSEVMRKK